MFNFSLTYAQKETLNSFAIQALQEDDNNALERAAQWIDRQWPLPGEQMERSYCWGHLYGYMKRLAK